MASASKVIHKEQHLIHEFHRLFHKNSQKDLEKLVDVIIREHPNSAVLQYYVGTYYGIIGHMENAKTHYIRSIELCPEFAPPYLNYATIVFSSFPDEIPMAERKLITIFNRPTKNGRNHGQANSVSIEDNLKIAQLLVPYYINHRRVMDAKHMCDILYRQLEPIYEDEFGFYYGWKDICYKLCLVYSYFDMEKAHKYAVQAYKLSTDLECTREQQDILKKLDTLIMTSIIVTSQYVLEPYDWKTEINSFYNQFRTISSPAYTIANSDKTRIRIGFISYNFNRNAVSLFLTPLFEYLDRDRFEVYCYYTESRKDFVTAHLQTIVDKWYDIHSYPRDLVFNMINQHGLDVLVDIDSHSYHGSMPILVNKPAPLIINYLGFPDYSCVDECTIRLTDSFAEDLEHGHKNHERAVCFPRSFLCFQPFRMFIVPPICIKTTSTKVCIGTLNKISKHNPVIRNIWKRIVQKYPFVEFTIKMNNFEKHTTAFRGFPYKQLRYLSFTDNLTEYYELFNTIDLCLDSYPYTGTATTCSALWMGVPTLTFYDRTRHVSSVTGSILRHLVQESEDTYYDDFITHSLEEYETRMCEMIEQIHRDKLEGKWLSKENSRREKTSKDFQEMMNPMRFACEFEELIEQIL